MTTRCGQLDLDFGASPNLFTDAFGNLVVGDLQKSGYYHAAYADTMDRAGAAPISGPCAACNADSAAVTGDAIVAVGTPGGVMSALGRHTVFVEAGRSVVAYRSTAALP